MQALQVSALHFRKKFGQLLDMAAAGKTIHIMRQNRPVAQLIAVDRFQLSQREIRRRRDLGKAIDQLANQVARQIGKTDSTKDLRRWRNHKDDRFI